MQIQFNTGRLYAKDGQPITAKSVTTEHGTFAIFRDHARLIYDVVKLEREPRDKFQLRDMVMHAYDQCLYGHLSDSVRALPNELYVELWRQAGQLPACEGEYA